MEGCGSGVPCHGGQRVAGEPTLERHRGVARRLFDGRPAGERRTARVRRRLRLLRCGPGQRVSGVSGVSVRGVSEVRGRG